MLKATYLPNIYAKPPKAIATIARSRMKLKPRKQNTQRFIYRTAGTLLPADVHLELHHHLWVHVNDIKPYRYQPELKQKLILREEQIDLIDILTAEMDVLMDDIVEGKSGGTTVLCAGPAGVGKTLTAEVYSELLSVPCTVCIQDNWGSMSAKWKKP